MKHGIINIAAQLTIVQTSTDYYHWNMCNSIAGHSPACIFDLSHPAEDLNQQVGYRYGATVLTTRNPGWKAFTQGSYIIGDNSIRPDANNALFQHEYGHYLQSQRMGPAYYWRVAIPSVRSEHGNFRSNYPSHDYHPVEQDANRRAFLYFNSRVAGFQNDVSQNDDRGWNFIENPLDVNRTGRGRYIDFRDVNQVQLLNNISVSSRWYDYVFGIFSGFYNAYQYNH